ncbi:cytochrome P450 [Actinophytocola sp.]|uniref:cytochrome P450 n=1 Tax=Actinophytocola sp. TaxID=1872138 RepID=UPI002ED21089
MTDSLPTYERRPARDRFYGWRPEIHHPEPGPGEEFPPGPRAPLAIQSLRTWAARNTYWPKMRERYGDTFTLRVAPVGRMVIVCRPEDVRTAAQGGPDVFPIGENNLLFDPLIGRGSVSALDGAPHRVERKRMAPAFHGRRISGVVSIMEQLAAEEVASWPVGSTFALVERMRRLTLKVIIRVVMGVEEPRRVADLSTALTRVLDVGTLDLLMWIWPGLTRVGPWRKVVAGMQRADDMLFEEIARSRRDPDREQRPDVLAMLLDGDPDDERVRVELLTLLLSGHETTAVGSAWMFERLLRHPKALVRVLEGLDDPDDEYRKAVVKETLRVRQFIYNFGRRLAAPVELGGYHLPAGTFVWPSIGAAHTDRGTWGEDADEFRPERWLEPDPPSRVFVPFGGGVHRCLGALFAETEMEIILRTVLRHVEVRPDRAEDETPVMRHIVQAPQRGARVRVVRRLGS